MDPWWTGPQAGWIGGGLGSLLGLLGGVFGMAAGLLVPRGKGKSVVLGLGLAIVGLGVLGLIGGITALVLGQPYHVWYPMGLIGLIGALVGGINVPLVMGRYRQAEARRMDAEQIRRG